MGRNACRTQAAAGALRRLRHFFLHPLPVDAVAAGKDVVVQLQPAQCAPRAEPVSGIALDAIAAQPGIAPHELLREAPDGDVYVTQQCVRFELVERVLGRERCERREEGAAQGASDANRTRC